MNTLELLNKYAALGKSQKIKADVINYNNKIPEYEELYNESLVNWTDEILLDYVVCKLKNNNMRKVRYLLSKFSDFYDYCCSLGYISKNPVDGMYLSNAFVIDKILSEGLLEFYTRDKLMNICSNESNGNSEYNISLVFSIFEGFSNLNELGEIEYSQVNHDSKNIIGYEKLLLSDYLINAYDKLAESSYFESRINGGATRQVPYIGKHLIKRKMSYNKTDKSESKGQKAVLSNRLKYLGLSYETLYDSGIITKLVDYFGKEQFLNFFFETDEELKISNNQKLDEFLRKNTLEVQDVYSFVYRYKIYAHAVKHGIIKL